MCFFFLFPTFLRDCFFVTVLNKNECLKTEVALVANEAQDHVFFFSSFDFHSILLVFIISSLSFTGFYRSSSSFSSDLLSQAIAFSCYHCLFHPQGNWRQNGGTLCVFNMALFVFFLRHLKPMRLGSFLHLCQLFYCSLC